MSQDKKTAIRVLLTKSAHDGHDRGIRVIAKALRDEGMEIIYTQFKLPEDIAAVAIQEHVDLIGISYFAGGQVKVTEKLLGLLSEKGIEDLPVIVGGTIRPFDVPKLEAMGVRGIFRGGDTMKSVADHIRQLVHG